MIKYGIQVFLYKLRQNGITGNLLYILTEFLKNRKQSFILNGQHSLWADVEAGAPLGSAVIVPNIY